MKLFKLIDDPFSGTLMEYLELIKISAHFLMSFGIVWFLRKKGMPVGVAMFLALSVGLSKEIIDTMMLTGLNFEWNDMHVNLIGCVSAAVISA